MNRPGPPRDTKCLTTIAAICAIFVLALAIAGCGSDDSSSGSDGTPGSTSSGAPADGKQIFADSGCGGCHTLAAAGSKGSSGPNLDELKPDSGDVSGQVRNGGGGMPSFDDDLSDAEIEAVSAFVADNAGQ
ncbi:MAG: cytochrome c [Solirubrobacterales bacterium]